MKIPIPKRFTGHAAHQLRALIKSYEPESKLEVMERLYDSADDGPEVEVIKFFKSHPNGEYAIPFNNRDRADRNLRRVPPGSSDRHNTVSAS